MKRHQAELSSQRHQDLDQNSHRSDVFSFDKDKKAAKQFSSIRVDKKCHPVDFKLVFIIITSTKQQICVCMWLSGSLSGGLFFSRDHRLSLQDSSSVQVEIQSKGQPPISGAHTNPTDPNSHNSNCITLLNPLGCVNYLQLTQHRASEPFIMSFDSCHALITVDRRQTVLIYPLNPHSPSV